MGQTNLKYRKDELAELVKHLPLKLRVCTDVELLEAALQGGLLCIKNDGTWEWLLDSKTLLAYFCGRMWCGDSTHYSHQAKGYVWDKSLRRFPNKDLALLFGVRNLRTLRKNRQLGTLPVGWELVEEILNKS